MQEAGPGRDSVARACPTDSGGPRAVPWCLTPLEGLEGLRTLPRLSSRSGPALGWACEVALPHKLTLCPLAYTP